MNIQISFRSIYNQQRIKTEVKLGEYQSNHDLSVGFVFKHISSKS